MQNSDKYITYSSANDRYSILTGKQRQLCKLLSCMSTRVAKQILSNLETEDLRRTKV